jgi:hypothetical protein
LGFFPTTGVGLFGDFPPTARIVKLIRNPKSLFFGEISLPGADFDLPTSPWNAARHFRARDTGRDRPGSWNIGGKYEISRAVATVLTGISHLT